MITTNIFHLRTRCTERGYTLDEVRPCIVSQDGEQVTVDETHPAYPRTAKPGLVPPAAKPVQPSQPPAPTHGPGAELKAILKDWLGIQASPNCSCNARARQMDEWGPDLCEQNLPTIVGWLEEQAKARNLPFVRFAGEQAVKLAIRRARKKARK
jgi:hypothetical protein